MICGYVTLFQQSTATPTLVTQHSFTFSTQAAAYFVAPISQGVIGLSVFSSMRHRPDTSCNSHVTTRCPTVYSIEPPCKQNPDNNSQKSALKDCFYSIPFWKNLICNFLQLATVALARASQQRVAKTITCSKQLKVGSLLTCMIALARKIELIHLQANPCPVVVQYCRTDTLQLVLARTLEPRTQHISYTTCDHIHTWPAYTAVRLYSTRTVSVVV